MFVVWGTKLRTEDGGVVADWCTVCGAVHAFRLTNHFLVRHYQYIALGRGTYAHTSRKCVQCGAENICDPREYARILSSTEATGKTVEDILKTTNPRLGEQIQQRRDFQSEIERRMQEGVPETGGGLDPRMLAALDSLKDFDVRDETVTTYFVQLRKWDYLTLSEREVVLREIESFTNQQNAIKETIHFLKNLPAAEPGWVTPALFFSFVGALTIGFWTIPFLRSWLWGTLFVIAVLVITVSIGGAVSRGKVREWVGSILVPRGKIDRINFILLMEILDTMSKDTDGLEEKLKDMVTQLETIRAELNKRGLFIRQPTSTLSRERLRL